MLREEAQLKSQMKNKYYLVFFLILKKKTKNNLVSNVVKVSAKQLLIKMLAIVGDDYTVHSV